MSPLVDSLVPAHVYNKLPHISEMSAVPSDHAQDLEDLRALLVKHAVSQHVSVRLLHRHYEAEEGEVMVIRKIAIPGHKSAQAMYPAQAAACGNMHGLHFFVNGDGTIQAYEYADFTSPDVSTMTDFLVDFRSLVVERGLEHKFGLKLNSDVDLRQISWREYEVPAKRSTVMLQDDLLLSEENVSAISAAPAFTVVTEWDGIIEHPRDCSHIRTCSNHSSESHQESRDGMMKRPRDCYHHQTCSNHPSSSDQALPDNVEVSGCLVGGRRIVPGSPMDHFIQSIVV